MDELGRLQQLASMSAADPGAVPMGEASGSVGDAAGPIGGAAGPIGGAAGPTAARPSGCTRFARRPRWTPDPWAAPYPHRPCSSLCSPPCRGPRWAARPSGGGALAASGALDASGRAAASGGSAGAGDAGTAVASGKDLTKSRFRRMVLVVALIVSVGVMEKLSARKARMRAKTAQGSPRTGRPTRKARRPDTSSSPPSVSPSSCAFQPKAAAEPAARKPQAADAAPRPRSRTTPRPRSADSTGAAPAIRRPHKDDEETYPDSAVNRAAATKAKASAAASSDEYFMPI